MGSMQSPCRVADLHRQMQGAPGQWHMHYKAQRSDATNGHMKSINCLDCRHFVG